MASAMVANRLADIFSLMERYDHDELPGRSLCRVAAEITELDGASISLSSSVDGMTSFGEIGETFTPT